MWFIWGFAVFWNAISSPLIFVVPGEVVGGNYPALLGLLFPLVGAALVWYAVRRTREWLSWGMTELELDPYPGAVGGHIGGRVEFLKRRRLRQVVNVTVQCVRSYVSGSGKNRSRRDEIVWQARGAAGRGASPNVVEFRFDVPADLPVSEAESGNFHLWRVQLSADGTDGVALDRSFVVPVVASGASSTVGVDTGAGAREAVREQLERARQGFEVESLARDHGLTIDAKGGWVRLFFPVGRQIPMAVMLLVIGCAFAVGGWFLAGEGGHVSWLMAPVFALVGLGMAAVGVYVPTNSLDVRISPSRIETERKWFGVTLRRQSLVPANVRSLELKRGSSTTVGAKTTVRYGVHATLADKKTACLAEGLNGQMAARAVRDMILEQAGLRPAGPGLRPAGPQERFAE